MQTDQIITFIRTVPIFHELQTDQLEELAGSAEVRDVKQGEVVVHRNDEGTELFIIVQGEFQVFLRQEEMDFETEISRLWPGDFFGEISIITGVSRTASIRAVAPSRALVLKRETIDKLLDSSPQFGRSLCRSLANYVEAGFDKLASIKFVQIEDFPKLKQSVGLLPARVSRLCQCLVVDRDADQLTVACVDPTDTRIRSFVSGILKDYHLEWVAISKEEFERQNRLVLGPEADAFSTDDPYEELAYVSPSGDTSSIADLSGTALMPRIFTQAIRSGASDIHIEPDDEMGRVRLRLDGRMFCIDDQVTPQQLKQLVSRLKVMAELDITNTRTPQDGRFMVRADDRRVEFRLSVMPCQGGEKAAMRLISPDLYLSRFDNLVLPKPVTEFARSLFESPSRLVLVTGPAGSGKTTTLYAALNSIWKLDQSINIVTIEDPIEYNLSFATQVQVNREVGMDFAHILRSILRQDPDVILVGEIRDAESAAVALEAASTGHLVLSSLHTHTALETLVRLRDLRVKPYLLADTLRGVMSQRLVPRLAPGCTEVVAADDPVIARLQNLGVLEDDFSGTLSRGVDTAAGPPGGESGRVGVFEVLAINDRLRDLIDRSEPFSHIERALDSTCHASYAQYSRFLLKEQLVSPDRIERIFPKQRLSSIYDAR